MAMLVSEITLGIDVSKDELVICVWETGEITHLVNDQASIQSWLDAQHGTLRVAIEPTSSYHLAFVEQAHAMRLSVYPVNPRQLAHYREAINVRNKTDPQDAWLLARYLAHEAASLRPIRPLSARAQQLWSLLKRRAVLVEARKQLDQSLRDISLPRKALFSEIRRVINRIDQRMKKLLKQLGWQDDYRRCLTIPGIGVLNAIALVSVFHRGTFATADAFVAFIGFDVRLRESGRFKGQRKLTKRGEAEVRRLLWCAAQPARSYRPFDRYYQQQLEKGLSKIAAKVILARKITRIAFALLSKQQSFKKQEIAYS